MEPVTSLFDLVLPFLPSGFVFVGLVVVLFLVHYLLEKRSIVPSARKFHQQITMLVISLGGVIVVVLSLPLSDSLRGQLIGLLGVVLSAAVALSSTTFIGNAMAGIMLRVVKVFKSGDFVEIEGHFGRVTERGLFHTEIQSEQRDLVTLPNLFLATHPLTVTRSSGTIVFAEVSLGYDVPRGRVELLLLEALERAELEEGYVQVRELGDYSVSYRAAGLLKGVKHLLSSRSRLRAAMLDTLHEGGVEIVSPTFMNTRAFSAESEFVPEASPVAAGPTHATRSPESIIFDKADDAETLDKATELLVQFKDKIDVLKKGLKDAEGKARAEIEARIARLKESQARLEAKVETLREDID